jgi:hypothetical protein
MNWSRWAARYTNTHSRLGTASETVSVLGIDRVSGILSERLIQPSASTRKRPIIRSSTETNIASTVDKVIGLRRL